MALIKSISGIRGTIGGVPGNNLTPVDIVKFASAYGTWLKEQFPQKTISVLIGRDGRLSGEMVQNLVTDTLLSLGIDVVVAGYSTTPTIEMGVQFLHADGGIIITASHNPKEWNALKLLNHAGEFVDATEGAKILSIAEALNFTYANVGELGQTSQANNLMQQHIEAVLNHTLVDVEAIKNAKFSLVADVVNSTGALILPMLFDALNIEKYKLIYSNDLGNFAHNPEPLPQHLTELSRRTVEAEAHLGIAVDPDVDRLCFVCEDGSFFGEEYTLVAVSDYVLSRTKGNTVSNMSSTRALRDVTEKHGGIYTASAVGEVNVVNKMKTTNAVIGGEGNGGIIIPELHYGRDAIIGIALFLSHLAREKKTASRLRKLYPDYFMSKNKIELSSGTDVAEIFNLISVKYKNHPQNTEDGLKIEFDTDWVHLRTSNTEPIIRIYAESTMEKTAANIAERLVKDITEELQKI